MSVDVQASAPVHLLRTVLQEAPAEFPRKLCFLLLCAARRVKRPNFKQVTAVISFPFSNERPPVFHFHTKSFVTASFSYYCNTKMTQTFLCIAVQRVPSPRFHFCSITDRPGATSSSSEEVLTCFSTHVEFS